MKDTDEIICAKVCPFRCSDFNKEVIYILRFIFYQQKYPALPGKFQYYLVDILENDGLIVSYNLPIFYVEKCTQISFPTDLFVSWHFNINTLMNPSSESFEPRHEQDHFSYENHAHKLSGKVFLVVNLTIGGGQTPLR